MEKNRTYVAVISFICILAVSLSASMVTQPEGPPKVGDEPVKADKDWVGELGALEKPYWQVQVYNFYTGSEWVNRGTMGEANLADWKKLKQKFKRNVETDLTPVAWRANDVVRDTDDSFSLDSKANVSISESGGVKESREGKRRSFKTYTVESNVPSFEESDLKKRSTRRVPGGDWYTQVPDKTPEKLERLTINIMSEASNDYERVLAVEEWLQKNKIHLLNVDKTGESIASRFVFDMKKGHAEYYATAMAVMLRTQNIPTRYVVGYKTGENRYGDTWEVEGEEAHAWVEVHFDDYGWVKFDPTPRTSPGAADWFNSQNSLINNELRSENTVKTLDNKLRGESTVKTLDYSRGRTDLDNKNLDSSTVQNQDSDLNITVRQNPVPGKTVEVVVRRNGEPVNGAVVEFNGKKVGKTDSAGVVKADVPYEDKLVVTAKKSGIEDKEKVKDEKDEEEGTKTDSKDINSEPPKSSGDGLGGKSFGKDGSVFTLRNIRETNKVGGRFTNVSKKLLFKVTLDGKEFEELSSPRVRDGEKYSALSYRDSEGYSALTYRDRYGQKESSSAASSSRRFSLDQKIRPIGETLSQKKNFKTITLDQETENASGSKKFNLQTQINVTLKKIDDGIRLKAKIKNVPVHGGVVRVGGKREEERVGLTNSSGVFVFSDENWDFSEGLSVAVEKGDAIGVESWNPTPSPGFPLDIVLVSIGGLGCVLMFLKMRGSFGDEEYESTQEAVISFSASSAVKISDFMKTGVKVLSGLSMLAPVNIVGFAGRSAFKAVSSTSKIFSSLSKGMSGMLSRGSETTNRGGMPDRENKVSTVEEDDEQDVEWVYMAWTEMVRHASLAKKKSMTAAEIARASARKGFPRQSVGELTRAFRKARYGGVGPNKKMNQTAKQALEEIETHLEDEKDGEDGKEEGSDDR